MAVAEVLLHLGHGNAEQLRDMGKVQDVLGRVEHILSGWNTAHRTESRTRDASA